jgi:hypothetical protein
MANGTIQVKNDAPGPHPHCHGLLAAFVNKTGGTPPTSCVTGPTDHTREALNTRASSLYDPRNELG